MKEYKGEKILYRLEARLVLTELFFKEMHSSPKMMCNSYENAVKVRYK